MQKLEAAREGDGVVGPSRGAEGLSPPGCQRAEGEPGVLRAVRCFCFASSGLCSQVLIEAVISREGKCEGRVLNTSVGLLQGRGPSPRF